MTNCRTEGAEREVQLQTDVRTDGDVDTFEHAVGDHAVGAFERFFSRLEDKTDFALEFVAAILETSGKREEHGGVCIMAAGVDRHGLFRIRFVGEGQGVDVGTKHDDGTGFGPLEGGADTVTADTRLRFVPGFTQKFGDEAGGFDFLVGEFGQIVELLPKGSGVCERHHGRNSHGAFARPVFPSSKNLILRTVHLASAPSLICGTSGEWAKF